MSPGDECVVLADDGSDVITTAALPPYTVLTAHHTPDDDSAGDCGPPQAMGNS